MRYIPTNNNNIIKNNNTHDRFVQTHNDHVIIFTYVLRSSIGTPAAVARMHVIKYNMYVYDI